jgi:hypothetical protein
MTMMRDSLFGAMKAVPRYFAGVVINLVGLAGSLVLILGLLIPVYTVCSLWSTVKGKPLTLIKIIRA